MIFRALATTLMSSIFNRSKAQVMEVAKASMLQKAQEDARKKIIAHVAQKYTEEVEHNISQYIRSLAEASVDVEFEGKPGQALISRAEGAIRELEIYIEKQNPDGAVIRYLQERYKEEGIRIITGRLYAGHYVNSTGQGTYEIMNKMGYATAVDTTRPWLTGEKTTEGVAEMIANAAAEIFELSFEDVDLSGELAELKFVGDVHKKLRSSPGVGFAPTPQGKKPAQRGKKKKRR